MRERFVMRQGRSGFTFIEAMIVCAILGVVMLGVSRVLLTSGATVQSVSSVDALDDRVRRTLARIVAEVRTSSMDQLDPQIAPNATSPELGYQVVTGSAGGAPLWGPPNRLRFTAATGSIELVRNEGMADEITAVIANGVPALLEGETLNNADDNGNGLVDESGLSFAFDGGLIRILLTMQAPGPDGTLLVRTVETRVRCWNG